MNVRRWSGIRRAGVSGGKADVLMTTDTLGGVWNYCVELAFALEDLGLRTLVAAMGAPITRSQRNDISALRNLDVLESNFRLEWMSDPWRDVARAGEWLLSIESEWHPSIIHLNGYAHAALNWRAPVIVVAHSCVLSWWRAVYGADAPSEWNAYREAVARGLAVADTVIAPSHAMLDSVRAIYGNPRRTCVIYNARRPSLFKPAEKGEYLFAAGRVWDQAKNFDLLDKIASSLPWKVYLAGPLAQACDQKRSCLSALTQLGNLSSCQMRQWLASAPVFIHPAKYEPFGLASLDAALSKCALVLGDIPSLRELWDGAAIFVSPDDPDQLRQSIFSLIRHQDLRLKLGDAAYQRALSFSPRRMAELYFRLYNEACERHDSLER